MKKTLFFVHVPKCAGMSLTNALRRDLPLGGVYQSTSLIENFRTQRPDFLEISEFSDLRAVIGHWVHEWMLPYLSGQVLFAASVRDPIERVRSQYRFDMTKRKAGWQPETEDDFLSKNRNVICGFLNAAFPSVRAEHDSGLESAKAILSGMDVVFDVPDASNVQTMLMQELGIETPSVRPENVSKGAKVEIGAAADQIRPYVAEDMKLYKWFKEQQAAGAGTVTNPVFDPQMREQFTRLTQKKRQPARLAEYLAKRLAKELSVEAADAGAMEATLWRRRIYAAELHSAFAKLRGGS